METETSNYNFKIIDLDSPPDCEPINDNYTSLDTILTKKVDSVFCGEIPASGSAEVTLENSSYIVLMSRADGTGLYIVHNGANAGISAISVISDVSLSVTGNTLSVANSGTAVRCAVIRFF